MRLKRRKAYNPKVQWTLEDEKILLNYIKRNEFDLQDVLFLFPQRNRASITSKVRKLRIKHDLFGDTYRDDKGEFTIKVAQKTKPKIVFDAYAGAGHQAFKWIRYANTVYASDIKKGKINQFSKTAKRNGFIKEKTKEGIWTVFKKRNKRVYFYYGDAIEGAIVLKASKVKIDLIDLDTCGSTIPTIPLYLLLLKPKHLVVTHGEFHSMRFQREDVLRRLLSHKDVTKTPFPIGVQRMSDELEKAVQVAGFRAHNETKDSFWLSLKSEVWLGSKFHGMLRRYFKVSKPTATADCLNKLAN